MSVKVFECTVDEFIAAIKDSADSQGMVINAEQTNGNVTQIESIISGSSLINYLLARPQKLTWNIKHLDECLEVTLLPSRSLWVWPWIFSLLLLLPISVILTLAANSPKNPALMVLFLLGVGFAGLSYSLGVKPESVRERWLRTIHDQFVEKGSFLQRTDSPSSKIKLVLWAAFVISSASPICILDGSGVYRTLAVLPHVAAYLMLLLLSAFCWFLTFRLHEKKSARSSICLSSIQVQYGIALLAVLLYLWQLPFVIVKNEHNINYSELLYHDHLLHRFVLEAEQKGRLPDTPPFNDIFRGKNMDDIEEIHREVVKNARGHLCMALLAIAATLGLFFAVFRHSLEMLSHAVSEVSRISSFPGAGGSQKNIAGDREFQMLRTSYSIVAIAGAVVVLVAVEQSFVLLFWIFTGKYLLAEQSLIVEGMEASCLLSRIALDVGPPATILTICIKAVWFSVAAFISTFFSLSIGQFFWQRHRCHSLLEKYEIKPDEHELLRKLLDDLEENSSIGPIRLSIFPEEEPSAWSARFGVFRAERWIQISSGVIDLFGQVEDADQLRAILAHEVAHHMAGHCFVDYSLQLFGRIAMTGDGFSKSIMNSVGQENKADALAVKKLGVNPIALRRALKGMHHACSAHVTNTKYLATNAFIAQHEKQESGTEESDRIPNVKNLIRIWIVNIRLFVIHFFGRESNFYFHPDVENRVLNLAALQEEFSEVNLSK